MALTDNLVSYWALDESSGNAADSVGSNTLTNNNTVTYATGKINNGADLERSSSQFLSIADGTQSGLDITGDISFSCWIKLESSPGSGEVYPIVAKTSATFPGGFAYRFIYRNDGGTLQFNIAYGDGTNVTERNFNSTLATDTWYHIAVTIDVSTKESIFYVNASANSGTGSGSATSIANTSANFMLGNDLVGAGRFFDGMVDEFGVWSRILSGAEITELYNSGNGFAYPFEANQELIAETGYLTLTGFDATLSKGYQLVAETGYLTLTGFDATLRKSGWDNTPKSPAPTWVNGTKSSTTWTNQSK